MLRVLVLGRDGMLGQTLKAVLGRSGDLFVAGTQRHEPSSALYFDVEEGVETLRALWKKEAGFDYVINSIGFLGNRIDPNRPDSIRGAVLVNALFPHDLARLAAEFGARVIHVSTDGVFAPTSGVCFEETAPSATDPYGQTKALGEVRSPAVLNIRCSLLGPDPAGKRGLMEWLRGQPRGADVPGYTDQCWNGVTTLQFALLCRTLLRDGLFDEARREAGTHHFCPNQTLSKFDVLRLLSERFRPDVTVVPRSSPAPSGRVLGTQYQVLRRVFGSDIPMGAAIADLASIL